MPLRLTGALSSIVGSLLYQRSRIFAWLICQFNLSVLTGCVRRGISPKIGKTLKNQRIVKISKMMCFTRGEDEAIAGITVIFAFDRVCRRKSSTSVPANTQSQPTDDAPQTNRYYTNKNNQVVHSPSTTVSGKAPDGASARCNDGTYSFSKHRSSTCSHHGSVLHGCSGNK